MPESEQEIVKIIATKSTTDLSEEQKKKVPEKAWVVEIRGYTYHWGGETFIGNTIVENLRRPEIVNPDIFKSLYAKTRQGKDVPMGDRERMFKEQILDQINFLFLYKSEEVSNPVPGSFEHIKGSVLARLLKPVMTPAAQLPPGGGGDSPQPGIPVAKEVPKVSRETWKPVGEIASLAHGIGAAQANKLNFGAGGAGGDLVGKAFPKDKGGAAAVEKQKRREFIVLLLWKEPLHTVEAPAIEAKKD